MPNAVYGMKQTRPLVVREDLHDLEVPKWGIIRWQQRGLPTTGTH